MNKTVTVNYFALVGLFSLFAGSLGVVIGMQKAKIKNLRAENEALKNAAPVPTVEQTI